MEALKLYLTEFVSCSQTRERVSVCKLSIVQLYTYTFMKQLSIQSKSTSYRESYVSGHCFMLMNKGALLVFGHCLQYTCRGCIHSLYIYKVLSIHWLASGSEL